MGEYTRRHVAMYKADHPGTKVATVGVCEAEGLDTGKLRSTAEAVVSRNGCGILLPGHTIITLLDRLEVAEADAQRWHRAKHAPPGAWPRGRPNR